MKTRSPLANPFHVALMVVATLFVINCAAYAFWLAGLFDDSGNESHRLVQFLHQQGEKWILIELAVLAVLTVASLVTDHWWRAPDGSAVAANSTDTDTQSSRESQNENPE